MAGRKPKAVCYAGMRTETCSEEAANLAWGGGGGVTEVTAEQSISPWRGQGGYSRWREQHKLKLPGRLLALSVATTNSKSGPFWVLKVNRPAER